MLHCNFHDSRAKVFGNLCNAKSTLIHALGDSEEMKSSILPSYTLNQVSTLLWDHLHVNPNMETVEIIRIVSSIGIYVRRSPTRHFRYVLLKYQERMAQSRIVNMAAFEGYFVLLIDNGHRVELITLSGAQMMDIRV